MPPNAKNTNSSDNAGGGSPSSSSSNEETMRKFLKPDPTHEQIITAIASTYNYDPSNVKVKKELDSYDDRNYYIEITEGTDEFGTEIFKKFLCKVYNGVESNQYIGCSSKQYNGTNMMDATSRTGSAISSNFSSLHLYSRIWNHINQTKYGVTTSSPVSFPNVIDSAERAYASVHELPVKSKIHSPAKLVIQLLKWVEGTTISSMPYLSIDSFMQAGSYLAKVCAALDDLTEQDEISKAIADRYHIWDGRNTLDIQNFVPCIEDKKLRAMVQNVLDTFRRELMEDSTQLDFRSGILMGDFNDANILVDGSGNVCGIIDFGCTVLSWRVLDVTIAMAYSMITNYGKNGCPISSAAAVLRGFHSLYPLTKNERKFLRLFTACRLSSSITLGAYSYQQNPQNQYVLLQSIPAQKMLELIWGSGDKITQAIEDIFDAACCNVTSTDFNISGLTIPEILHAAGYGG